jgi:hypothetical protein
MATPASVKAATEKMIARVQADLDALKAQLASASSGKTTLSAEDQADLDAAEANIDALDPTKPDVLPVP